MDAFVGDLGSRHDVAPCNDTYVIHVRMCVGICRGMQHVLQFLPASAHMKTHVKQINVSGWLGGTCKGMSARKQRQAVACKHGVMMCNC